MFLCAVLIPIVARAADEPEPRSTGRLEARVGDKTVVFPSLKLDVSAEIEGDLATVSVEQTFVNPFTEPMHATYLFPLNHEAAVFEMLMEVGEERIRAEIQERAEAVRTFQEAKAAGKAASLLQEHRPNMFTQDVANLMPGLPIRVRLRYVQTVPKQDGAYALVVPLVVGPRYVPASPVESQPVGSDAQPSLTRRVLDSLPRFPRVSGIDLPDTIERDRVSLAVHLRAGLPISDVKSSTHSLATQSLGAREWRAHLAEGRSIDNRDFVLTYTLAGQDPAAGLLAAHDERGGFFSLLLEPPRAPTDAEIGAREMVFVLDCSGSMDGLPIDASKAFMREALRRLRPEDTFRIIRFSDGATEFSKQPLAATEDNVERGVAYVDSLSGEGGTEMLTGIRQALSVDAAPDKTRLVVFLTDGYIGNEYEVLALLRSRIGDARLFAFGVGSGVNRFLLDRMGTLGRGFTRYMDSTENVKAVAKELADRLDAPVLTDIRIDWGSLDPRDVAPQGIPDLFAGGSVRVQGRYAHGGQYHLVVHGRVRGREAALPMDVTLPEASPSESAIPLVWARASIASLMDDLSLDPAHRDSNRSNEDLQAEVTRLGLEFGLVTRWTSFVAVSEKVVNSAPEDARTVAVPLHRVKGVTDKAYGRTEEKAGLLGGGATASSTVLVADAGVSGSPTPEPGSIAGLIVTLLAGAGAWRRRREARDRA
jgi:Ca-activated chloride channel family protein